MGLELRFRLGTTPATFPRTAYITGLCKISFLKTVEMIIKRQIVWNIIK